MIKVRGMQISSYLKNYYKRVRINNWIETINFNEISYFLWWHIKMWLLPQGALMYIIVPMREQRIFFQLRRGVYSRESTGGHTTK